MEFKFCMNAKIQFIIQFNRIMSVVVQPLIGLESTHVTSASSIVSDVISSILLGIPE